MSRRVNVIVGLVAARGVLRLIVGQGMMVVPSGVGRRPGDRVRAPRLMSSLLSGSAPRTATFVAVSVLLGSGALVARVVRAVGAARATILRNE